MIGKRKRRSQTRSRRLTLETLEARQLLSANPVISEFLARNDGGLRDGNGRSSDWIEIYNAGDEPADLAGYRLTDDAAEPAKWTFPSTALGPGEYVVVFASGQDANDYVDPAGNLHTNFTLRRAGEYLAFISPSGSTLSEFGTSDTDYPEQIINVSYGMAQTSGLITRESVVEYAVPMDAAIDSEWMKPEFDAAGHGFTLGTAAIGVDGKTSARNSFKDLFDTELPANTHAVYARYDFTFEDASSVSGLQLDLFYDDGFIAYLNGQRVLAESAPETGSLFTTALSERADGDALESHRYDLSQWASLLVDGTNVLAIHGLNHLSDREDLLLAPSLQAVSGGVRLADGSDARTGFLTTPTPGAANVGNSRVFDGVVFDTSFTHDRGFYDEPFSVEIASETTDAQIRYTLDGSTPTALHGTAYAGPIEVTTTTTLRAAAFKPNYLSSNVDTQTYIFLNDVLKQPADPAGFPSRWGRAGAADYAMDPRITTDVTSPYYDARVREALLTFPTMSIVTDSDNLFDTSTGIYSNPQSAGVAWERPASMEFFDPDSDREIQVNAGLRIQGKASRNPNRPKHNMRLLFKGDYGPTKLNFPLFEETTVDQFDTFILRGQNGDSWFHPSVNSRDPQYIRDQWLRDVQRAMGRPTPAQDHVHLYINGLYWGLFHTIEKPNASYFAEHFGGEKEEYDVLQHQGGTVDGNRDVWNQVMAMARAGLRSDAAVEAVGQYVDIEGMIDYLLINFYSGNTDWDQNNWFGGRRRTPEGRFIFFTWDAERTFLNVNENVTTKNISNQPTELHTRLRDNDEYRLQFADQVHRHFFNDGLLTPEQAEARWMRWADEIELALWGEAARWGDAKRSQPYTPDGQWIADLNKFREDYFPRRTDVVLSQLQRQNLYPDVAAPSFSQHGGMIAEGFALTMSAPEGSVLYTTDGSDPRLAGGAAAPGAVFYADAVPIADGMTVKARVVNDGEWSALNEATFRVASPLAFRITELNFNPYSDRLIAAVGQDTIDSDQYEFIELANVGSETVDLAGVKLEQHDLNGRPQGIRFQFASQTLRPGEHVVVVRDREAFAARYGTSHRIAAGADGEEGAPGQFGGNLENSGEQITLVDSTGRIIQQFQYGFSGDWPARADGRGSSLEIVDPWGDPADPTNWQASVDFGGSPNRVATAGNGRVRLNELLTNPNQPGRDLVELRNLTGTDIDVGGWFLSDTEADYLRFRIPDSTIIPASGYTTLDGQPLGLDLDGDAGGRLHLIEADPSGRPLRFADLAIFGPSFIGTSLGPSPSALSTWSLLNDATFGAENSGPLIPEVFISEIHVNPVDPDGDGQRYDVEDFRFVELTNHTDQPQDISDWRLDGDITYAFPGSTVLQPGESVIVVPFRSTDVGAASVFRFTTEMPPAARIFGRYRGEIPIAGAKVQLIRPLQPGDRNSPEFVAEQVVYQSSLPWPDISTVGHSLNRTNVTDSPDSPASWLVDKASPGQYQAVDRVVGDANGDGRFNQLDIVQVLARAKYLTGAPAGWEDGDWNGDGGFDQLDVVFALQSGDF